MVRRLAVTERSADHVRVPRAASTRNRDELARIVSPPSTARCISDAKGEVARGMEVVEFACGIAHASSRASYPTQVSTASTSPRSASRWALSRASRRSTSRRWCPMWMHPMAIASGNTFVLKPQRADPSASHLDRRAATPRRGCPTASSTSCTATRSRSTRSSTTPTSPRSPSSARRRSPATSTTARPRPASACRRSAARRTTLVLPDADLDFAADHVIAAAYGSAGRALHGDLGGGRGRPAGDALVDKTHARRPRRSRSVPGNDPRPRWAR